MSEQKSFFANLVSNPTSFSILVLSAVILIVWLDQRQPHSSSPSTSAPTSNITPGQSKLATNLALNAPTFDTGNTPQVMNQMGGSASSKNTSAPAISGLLPQLEAKVKADPSNTNNRLLLAETYRELGMTDKALKTLHKLQAEQPKNSDITLVLASVLSKSDNPKDLKEALKVLDKLAKDKTIEHYLVDLYRGDALIRQVDNKGALKSWKAALAEMPQNDSGRAKLQQKINDLMAANKGMMPDKSAGTVKSADAQKPAQKSEGKM